MGRGPQAWLTKSGVGSSIQIAGRIVNPRARSQLYKFRRAIEEAEREIPGLMNIFSKGVVFASTGNCALCVLTEVGVYVPVSDIVDSVERVGTEEEQDPEFDFSAA